MNVIPLAAIDIGSNAVRLMISNVERYPSETVFKKITLIRVPLRLGADVFTHGYVGDERRQHLYETMMGFKYIMKAYNVLDYRACATSAMREAGNGEAIMEYVKKETGINIEILSGMDEADLIFDSGMDKLLGKDNSYVYVDVGGGSTEITIYSGGKRVDSSSFPVGTVRWLSGKVDENTLKYMKRWLKRQASQYNLQSVIGSGGNINKVMKLLGKRELEPMSYTEIRVLRDHISSYSYEDRVHLLKLNVHRADVIIPAMDIFMMVMKSCKINDVMAPKMGLVDGIISNLYKNYAKEDMSSEALSYF